MQSTDSLQNTDLARWRLRTNSIGVHFWHYLSEDEAKNERPQSYPETYFLGLPRVVNRASHLLPSSAC
jgi:lanosterol synthase